MKFLLFSSFARLVLDRDPQRVSGGAELQMGLLAQALVQRGHEVTLLGAGTDFTDEPVIDGVQIRVGGRFDSGGLLDTLRSFVRVAQVLKTDRPEWVVIMGAGTWLWLLWLLQLPLGFAVAFITASDIDADGSYRKMFPLRGWLYEFALGRVARTIAMSEYQRQGLIRFGLQPGFYRNLLLASPNHPVTKDIDFLWVSSAQQLKQPEIFLHLAEQLPHRHFVMICPLKDNPSLFDSIQLRASALANIEFYPLIPYHEVQTFFQRAQIFVNTSDYEGFPNTFLQAGLARTALLSLRVDPDEIITRHGSGICACGDIENFYQGATTMINNPQALLTMQERVAEYVALRHNTEANLQAFLAALHQQ